MSKNEHGKRVGGGRLHCSRENSRWKGPQARAHHEPLSPGGGMAASGARRQERGRWGWAATPPPLRVRMPLHKAEGLRADKACSKRAFWGLPWWSSGLRRCFLGRGAQVHSLVGEQGSHLPQVRAKTKKKKFFLRPSVAASRRTVAKEDT